MRWIFSLICAICLISNYAYSEKPKNSEQKKDNNHQNEEQKHLQEKIKWCDKMIQHTTKDIEHLNKKKKEHPNEAQNLDAQIHTRQEQIKLYQEYKTALGSNDKKANHAIEQKLRNFEHQVHMKEKAMHLNREVKHLEERAKELGNTKELLDVINKMKQQNKLILDEMQKAYDAEMKINSAREEREKLYKWFEVYELDAKKKKLIQDMNE